MSNMLADYPNALDHLNRLVGVVDVSPLDMALPLKALQRMGLSPADLRVHVERLRAINEVTAEDADIEDNCILALDLIEGHLSGLSLDWGSAETARNALPKVLSEESVRTAMETAFVPSNLLPPRPTSTLRDAEADRLAAIVMERLRDHRTAPQPGDFFRAPKVGFTSRPAALLAPEDRIVYEAFVRTIEPFISASAPDLVQWPPEGERSPHDAFANAPREWSWPYVAVTDVESFYECVDHAILCNILGSRFRVPAKTLRALEAFLDTVMEAHVGLPQGPRASELLATAYLTLSDERLVLDEFSAVRYADDYLIGAESVADGRVKLMRLESYFRPLGLRLNPEKTRVLRRETYVDALSQPSKRVRQLRQEIRLLMPEPAVEDIATEVADVGQVLRSVGLKDDDLWAVMYHRRGNIGSLLKGLRRRFKPPLLEAYSLYLERTTERLRAGDFPDSMLQLERDIRECLTVLTTGRREIPLDALSISLRWLPRLAPDVSEYLIAMSSKKPQSVTSFVRLELHENVQHDWVTSWLCYAAEESVEAVPVALSEDLRAVARGEEAWGILTRSGAVRALAKVGRLDRESWESVLGSASGALRAELLLARWAGSVPYPQSGRPLSLIDPLHVNDG